MRRISRTMLMVGMIFAFVLIGIFAMSAIGCFVLASPLMKDAWMKAAEEAGAENPEMMVMGINAGMIALGVTFILLAGLSIPTAIVAKKGRDNPTSGLLVANIVMGAVCGTYFSIAGGVLGLIANKREERNARRAKVIDAK